MGINRSCLKVLSYYSDLKQGNVRQNFVGHFNYY